MGDYVCIHCEDFGDQCIRCSYFFYPESVHKKCDKKWKDHEVRTQRFYAPYTMCPDKDS